MVNLAVDAAHGGSQSSLDRSEGESDVGSSRPARRTARVLIVEDNADDAKLMVHTIGQSDITISAVQVVETKPAFIEALAAFRPDVILADYTLPSFTGAEALTIALQALPHVPFIFVTGTLGEERAVELLHQGAADYVLKDRSARLGPAISRALDEAAMRAEREIQARQLEQANTALTQSNNELEQFAYIASHDLSAPLHTVAGFVQLLAQRYQGKLDAQADEFIGFTLEGVARLERLIQDLLTYSRATRVEYTFERVDCTHLVHDVVEELQVSNSVRCSDLPTVQADAGQLRRVFQNLVSNALKFVPAERVPSVTISAEKQDGCWSFSVADNGIGIADEHKEEIFQMFKRLHSQDDYPGSGIGLAVSRRIVERHGGTIWVESSTGEGSIFHFTIPAQEDDL